MEDLSYFGSNPYRVYVVEDDFKLADLLCDYLSKYGYNPCKAQRFDDIKSKFLEAMLYVVLLDINLPYIDGFYWCRQIRTILKVPVIFMSARTDDPDQIRPIENGGDDYITKPFNAEVMLAKVKSTLRRTYGEYSTEHAMRPDVLERCGFFFIGANA